MNKSLIKSQVFLQIEFCFLIDQSFSMEGKSNTQVQQALRFSLKNLPAGSRFALFTFAKSCSEVFQMTDTCEEALLTAYKVIDGLKPSENDTNILAVLKKSQEKEIQEGFERHVVLITDGDVPDEQFKDIVIEINKQMRTKKNLSYSAIGIVPEHTDHPGVMQKLVKAVSEHGKGYHEILTSAKRVPAAIYSLMKKSICQTFKITNIKFHGMKVLYHDKLRQLDFDVTAGEEFHMNLIVDQDGAEDDESRPYISYDVIELYPQGNTMKSFSLFLEGGDESKNDFDGKLVAHMICSQLAKYDDELGNPDRNPINSNHFSRRTANMKSVREDIEFIGTFYAIPTKYTAMYIEPRVTARDEQSLQGTKEVKQDRLLPTESLK